MHDERGFQRRLERVETLVGEIEGLSDPTARAVTQELLGTLLELHGEGLARVLARLDGEGATGHALIGDLAADELVSSLLLLHGLHPDDLPTRVRRAVAAQRA